MFVPFPFCSAISQMLHNPPQVLTNFCNYKSRFVRWTMSGLGQASVAGHPTFSSILIFLCFFLWFHDDLPWFPYGFPIVSMFRVCVACATTSCCGPPWCLGGYGSFTNTGISKTLRFLRIASFCSKFVEVYGCFSFNYWDFYGFPT